MSSWKFENVGSRVVGCGDDRAFAQIRGRISLHISVYLQCHRWNGQILSSMQNLEC